MPTTSDSRPVAAHELVAYGGALFAAGVLLHQLWSGASLEHVLSSAATSGLIAYLTLAVGFAAARSIVVSPPDSDAPESSDSTSEASTAELDTEEDQTAPEPQVA